MNVELLQQIKTAILAEPDAFRMDKWSCGTAHCIAGWALHLNDLKIDPADTDKHASSQRLADGRVPWEVADELLGLEIDHGLFDLYTWPQRLRLKYGIAASRRERAEVAVEAIDAFIAGEDFNGDDDDDDIYNGEFDDNGEEF